VPKHHSPHNLTISGNPPCLKKTPNWQQFKEITHCIMVSIWLSASRFHQWVCDDPPSKPCISLSGIIHIFLFPMILVEILLYCWCIIRVRSVIRRDQCWSSCPSRCSHNFKDFLANSWLWSLGIPLNTPEIISILGQSQAISSNCIQIIGPSILSLM
jgi:hypothetical protein